MVIEWMVKKHGLNHVGLLTLTFGVPGSGRGSQATKELWELDKEQEITTGPVVARFEPGL